MFYFSKRLETVQTSARSFLHKKPSICELKLSADDTPTRTCIRIVIKPRRKDARRRQCKWEDLRARAHKMFRRFYREEHGSGQSDNSWMWLKFLQSNYESCGCRMCIRWGRLTREPWGY